MNIRTRTYQQLVNTWHTSANNRPTFGKKPNCCNFWSFVFAHFGKQTFAKGLATMFSKIAKRSIRNDANNIDAETHESCRSKTLHTSIFLQTSGMKPPKIHSNIFWYSPDFNSKHEILKYLFNGLSRSEEGATKSENRSPVNASPMKLAQRDLAYPFRVLIF